MIRSTPEATWARSCSTHSSTLPRMACSTVDSLQAARDHTIVLHGVDKIHTLMRGDSKFRKTVDGNASLLDPDTGTRAGHVDERSRDPMGRP